MALVFSGGPIRTMDPSRPDAEALLVEGDRIVALGSRAELEALAPHAGHHDLAGALLVPGFIDAHNHLSVAALHPRWRDVGAAGSPDELLTAVREQARDEPDAAWIRVCNWNEAPHGVEVSRSDLDGLGLDRPIVVVHYSLHQAVVCSRALDVLGIDARTPDPDGGRIGRDDRGRPTGLLLEQAWSQAHAASLAAYAQPERWADLVEARARVLHQEGITAVHDAACSPEAEAVYRTLAAQGRLPVGVVAMPHSSALLSNDAGARLEGPPTGDGDEHLRVGATKLFADGGIAIAIDVTMHGHPIRYGMTMSDLTERALAAAERGFDVAVHAIGNVGVDAAIGAFRAVRSQRFGDRRALRIEHVGIASRQQCAELAALGVTAVVQPNFVEHVGTSSAGARFDHHHWLPFRSLADAGVALAASSDDPCAPWSPLWGAIRGAARTTLAGAAFEPEEALGMDRWLHAMTAGAAAAGGQAHERGTLAPGLRADLVELRGRLAPPEHRQRLGDHGDPEHPGDSEDPDAPRVCATWVGGERVWVAAG